MQSSHMIQIYPNCRQSKPNSMQWLPHPSHVPTGEAHILLLYYSNSCRTVLMYPRGALQVQCSLCQTLNDAQQANQLGHVVCGGCQITLMYAYGAQSVKCALCNHVTPLATSRPPPSHQHQYAPHHPSPYPPPTNQHSGRPPTAPYQPPHLQQQQQQQGNDSAMASNKPPVQAVLVENPPTLERLYF